MLNIENEYLHVHYENWKNNAETTLSYLYVVFMFGITPSKYLLLFLQHPVYSSNDRGRTPRTNSIRKKRTSNRGTKIEPPVLPYACTCIFLPPLCRTIRAIVLVIQWRLRATVATLFSVIYRSE